MGIGIDLMESHIRQAMDREAAKIDTMIYERLIRDAAYWRPMYALTIDKEGNTTLNKLTDPYYTATPAPANTIRVKRPTPPPTLNVENIPIGHLFLTDKGNVYLRTTDSYVQVNGSVFFVIRRDKDNGMLPPLNVLADLGPLNVVVE